MLEIFVFYGCYHQKMLKWYFLVADERAVSTTELIELIAQALGKKVYLVRVPFFPKGRKSGNEMLLPFTAEEGIGLMISISS